MSFNTYKALLCSSLIITNSAALGAIPARDSSTLGPEAKALGLKGDDIVCTCLFNKNREWNSERIIWKEYFWYCYDYKDDGTCRKVDVLKGVRVE